MLSIPLVQYDKSMSRVLVYTMSLEIKITEIQKYKLQKSQRIKKNTLISFEEIQKYFLKGMVHMIAMLTYIANIDIGEL